MQSSDTSRFSSDRHFFLVGFHASHGLLLFRSPKHRDGATTRIDVLIKDVRAVELRAWTDGLLIEEVDAARVSEVQTRPLSLIEPGNRVYALAGDGWNGYVVGGALFTAEDDKEIGDPSPLIESPVLGFGIR